MSHREARTPSTVPASAAARVTKAVAETMTAVIWRGVRPTARSASRSRPRSRTVAPTVVASSASPDQREHGDQAGGDGADRRELVGGVGDLAHFEPAAGRLGEGVAYGGGVGAVVQHQVVEVGAGRLRRRGGGVAVAQGVQGGGDDPAGVGGFDAAADDVQDVRPAGDGHPYPVADVRVEEFQQALPGDRLVGAARGVALGDGEGVGAGQGAEPAQGDGAGLARDEGLHLGTRVGGQPVLPGEELADGRVVEGVGAGGEGRGQADAFGAGGEAVHGGPGAQGDGDEQQGDGEAGHGRRGAQRAVEGAAPAEDEGRGDLEAEGAPREGGGPAGGGGGGAGDRDRWHPSGAPGGQAGRRADEGHHATADGQGQPGVFGELPPHGRRVADPAGRQGAEELGDECAEGDAQQREAEVQGEEHADDLAGGEADGLEDGDVAEVAADPAADGAAHRQRRGEQRAEPEEAEKAGEQAVVAGGIGAGLAPGGDVGDLVGAEPGDGPLDDVVGVRGVAEPEADGAAVLVLTGIGGGKGPGQHPADTGGSRPRGRGLRRSPRCRRPAGGR